MLIANRFVSFNLRRPVSIIPVAYKACYKCFSNQSSSVSAIVLRPIVFENYRKNRNKEETPRTTPELHLAEAERLVEALEWECVYKTTVPVREINSATFLGKGKVEEIRTLIHGHNANVIIVDAKLSPVQIRNLSEIWDSRGNDLKVLDRFGLILQIFANRARTKESKLQVELASLAYQKTRLIDSAKMASEKQTSGVGKLGGFGETRLELDRRKIMEKEKKLRAELEKVAKVRKTQRASRSHLPVIAVVGYTNAGKSALINRLTGAERDSKNQLFTSLDSHSHLVVLPSGKKALLTDTVGFISDLPNILSTAFKSTLEETLDADVILHVRDISIGHTEFQKKSVLKLLRDLKCDKKLLTDNYLEVCNKVDLMSTIDPNTKLDDSIYISAMEGTNCDVLLKNIDSLLLDFEGS